MQEGPEEGLIINVEKQFQRAPQDQCAVVPIDGGIIFHIEVHHRFQRNPHGIFNQGYR